MITISKPIFDKSTIRDVTKILESGFITQGKKTTELEKKIAQISGTKYAVLFNSGTAALHTSLMAIGIRPGDEVITTPFTFIATINAIIMCGGIPVFIDVDSETFNIDVSKIEEKITKKTKAVLSVDLYGQPSDYHEIKRITKKHKLKFISDACQAIGAKYNGKKIATIADVTCFSFYATKNISMGEGGGLVTNDMKIYEFARRFRHHGQDPEKPYEYFHLGYNYRTTDIASVIGLHQLQSLPKWTKIRQDNAKKLTKGLSKIKGIIVPKENLKDSHVFHQYTIRLTRNFPISRDALHSYLLKKGIKSGIYYPTIVPIYNHVKNVANYKKGDLPVAEEIASQVISLPVHPGLTNADIAHIISALESLK